MADVLVERHGILDELLHLDAGLREHAAQVVQDRGKSSGPILSSVHVVACLCVCLG